MMLMKSFDNVLTRKCVSNGISSRVVQNQPCMLLRFCWEFLMKLDAKKSRFNLEMRTLSEQFSSLMSQIPRLQFHSLRMDVPMMRYL